MIPTERHTSLFVSPDEIGRRISNLRKNLEHLGVSAAVIEHKTDLYYFTGSAQTATLIIPVEGEVQYLVKRSFKRAEVESPLKVEKFSGSKDLFSRITKSLANNKKLGLALDVTPANQYLKYSSSLEGVELVDISMSIRFLKAVKSAYEIEQLKLATKQVEPAFELLPDLIKPGKREIDISVEIESLFRRAGHPGPIRIRRTGLDLAMILVTAGNSACYPHSFDGPVGGEAPDPVSPAGSGFRVLEAGDTLIADLVTSYNGYHGDNARSFAVGKGIDKRAIKAHEFCLDVLDKLENTIKPGMSGEEIYRKVSAYIETKEEPEGFMGYGDNRVKFFGHGIGLELDEFPIIADRVKFKLEENMVFALEPKAFLRNIGPVGVENTYLLTKDGPQSLCKTERKLIFC